MVSTKQLARSKAIQQRTGLTFHVATRLLPGEVRHATYVLYAFFRVADDVVDDPEPGPPEEQRRRLEAMRAVALGEREPATLSTEEENAAAVLGAFAELRENQDIPDREVDAFIDAMQRDVEPEGFETHADLSAYLRGSSVAVGAMMLALMDVADEAAARPHANALAEAFQLTNFVRDVREDVQEYDRVYLPRSSLEARDCQPEDVRRLEPTPDLRAVVADELERTERLYREGVAGIHYLPRDCQLAVVLAAVLYADHHRLIRRLDCDVFSARPTLSVSRRLWLAARTWLAFKRTGDPEATFYRVSAVEPAPETSGRPGPPLLDRVRSRAGGPIQRIADGGLWRGE